MRDPGLEYIATTHYIWRWNVCALPPQFLRWTEGLSTPPLMMNLHDEPGAYKGLCSLFYEYDKPTAPPKQLDVYLRLAKAAQEPFLEPMCGTGRFLIPFAQKGYEITGFDNSVDMLQIARDKCEKMKLPCQLAEASFEDFKSDKTYGFIFIPEGSFSLLIAPAQVESALTLVKKLLMPGGYFAFELVTVEGMDKQPAVATAKWVTTPTGGKIVHQCAGSQFDPITGVQTSLGKYELWTKQGVLQTETEVFQLRLYTPTELDSLLVKYDLEVIEKNPSYPEGASLESAEGLRYVCRKV